MGAPLVKEDEVMVTEEVEAEVMVETGAEIITAIIIMAAEIGITITIEMVEEEITIITKRARKV